MARSSSRSSHATNHRLERVAGLIRQAMAEILARGDIIDETLEHYPVTIPAVRMSPDLKLATIAVLPLGGREKPAILEALNRHKKEFRMLVARKINLKFAPQLRFVLDLSFDSQAHIDALLNAPEVVRDLGPTGSDEDRA